NSRIGRHEWFQVRQLRPQPWTLAEAQDGHVRQPLPAFRLVAAQRLQPPVQIACERLRTTLFVVEREHAHAPGLAVAPPGEQRPLGQRRRSAQGLPDPGRLLGRTVPEEGQRDVQVVGREDPDARHALERFALPAREGVDGFRREPKSAEETYPLTAL